ncbi:type I polyketide synthase [Mycobacterium sp. HUMS_1102779]|uniref:type I polyketide synthase n=1 Tax=Mycobacterium sp. HUMS_1102779 TaxID=3383487 RepID=UPI003899C2D3
MTGQHVTNSTESTSNTLPPNAIAVVGMAGRFPGADSVSQFWDNLRRGEESIVSLSDDELSAAGVGEKALAGHGYVKRAPVMNGIEEFDAEFFGFTPQNASMTDPQHRLMLQCAFHALEDAGYDPEGIDASVGMFGTSSASGYLLHNLMSHHDPHAIIGQGATFEMVNLSLQNDKDHLATRVAHQLNLRGPALSVQTACSSSLVAVHLACQSILNGECDMALAGGASIRVPHRVGYWYQPGSMVSPTGRCRPFDSRADGTLFGSGVGVVVLKPLQDALADGDRVHAVIRGSAINNDGSTKMTYAAPNAAGQAEVIAEAHAVSDVDASSISYVETHGTGTPLGDPIEIEGLRQAFGLSESARPGPCQVGSVKSNIGHLETAAGMAGLIKTILCLQHRAIPATLHFTHPNPELHLERGPFAVRGEYGPWDWDGVRRAGVSAFGVGGTNAHVVLEEAPAVPAAPAGTGPAPQVLVLSARTGEALADAREALAAELSGPDAPDLADVAYTLARRRTENVRMAAVVDGGGHAAEVLRTPEHDNVFVAESAGPPASTESDSERVAFLFPGQGSQHVGMARGLYETEPVFAEHFDRCVAAFDAEMGIDLRAEVFDGSGRSLERTDRTQPALFSVEYALAKLADSHGIRPAALAGHSIGEYAAATIAGVFDLPTAVKAVSMRARLMHAAPRGVMVAVAAGPDTVAEHLSADVDLAAVNEPGGCVVAGSEESIRAFTERLAQQQLTARRVRTSHAFHSRLMDSVVPEFQSFLARLTLREPQIPLLSNVTGTWMSAAEATDPATWARQIRSTVRFADEIAALLAEPGRVLVEVGPGGTLTSSAARHPRWTGGHRAVRLMRHPVQNRDDRDAFLLGLGQLWSAGVDVDWTPRAAGRRPTLVSLPGYPFVRQRHWVDAAQRSAAAYPMNGNGAAPAPTSANGAGAARPATGAAQLEDALRDIWAQCLGGGPVDRNADFFELGGDSLIAISVAMTAANRGLDLTPQDLYENPSVAKLSKTLSARYEAGGLARLSPDDVAHPPVPPNIEHFLAHGLSDGGHWRIPLILRLRPDVQAEDITAVLTAVTNQHDALRMRLVHRGGTWEQDLGEPVETVELGAEPLPGGLAPGGPEEREALLQILRAQIRDQDLAGPPLVATHVRGGDGGPCYLVLSVHGTAADTMSRDILLTDVFTAFGQRLAGEEITLGPVTTPWRDWCQRCAGLAAHPAVLESREYWLETAAKANLRVAEPATEPPTVDDLVRLPSALTVAETTEIDDARRRLGVPLEHVVVAALTRTVAAAVGDGCLALDLGGPGRSVLKPDVDLHRTVGSFTTVHPVALPCAQDGGGGVRQLFEDVHDTLKSVPHYGIGYGLLRYVYARTAGRLAATPPADIFFSYAGTIPDLPSAAADEAPVQFDSDTALPVREAYPGLGHAVELRVYRSAGAVHLDWWYDSRRIDAARARSLADALSATLLDLARAAVAEDESASADEELTLVDLSSSDST